MLSNQPHCAPDPRSRRPTGAFVAGTLGLSLTLQLRQCLRAARHSLACLALVGCGQVAQKPEMVTVNALDPNVALSQAGPVLSEAGLLPGIDSVTVLISGLSPLRRAELVRVHARLQLLFSPNVRLVERDTVSTRLAQSLGLTATGSALYLIADAEGVIRFRLFGHPSSDVHRQLLEVLPPHARKLQPVPPAEVSEWTRRVSSGTFLSLLGDTISGRGILNTVDRIVVMEAACSVCRREEHIRRLTAALDSNTRYAIVGDSTILTPLATNKRLLLVSFSDPVGLSPELGAVSRDVSAADPVVLTVRRGTVVTSTRLSRTSYSSEGNRR